MTTKEMFDSSVRRKGDFAGVFECDGDIGYFYLYKVDGGEGHKVLDSLRVISGPCDLEDADVVIRWDTTEQRVGLFIKQVIWAMFNVDNGAKYCGQYGKDKHPEIPDADITAFLNESVH